MNDIRVENIRAGYGKKEILKGISLSAGQGELVAIIGPNGAGKSTLLKVIAGFLRPSSGSVTLDGRDITRLAAHDRSRNGIAYFMQGGRVFPNLSVRENLAMAGSAVSRPDRDRLKSETLELFPALKEMSGRRAGLLSGGERQSLALAMAIMQQPSVLLLDEPSAGLSPRLVREVLDKVKEVGQTRALTILMVEQNVRAALKIAHRAVAMVAGRVAAGTSAPDAWLQDDTLGRLYLSTGVPPDHEAD